MMMTVAERRGQKNLDTVEAFYEAERRRDLPTWVSFWNPAGRQTFPFAPERTVSGIAALERITARKFAVRPPYEIRTRIEGFADPDRVLARLHLVFDTEGVVGQTHIWCVFHFDADGKVLEVEEMLDTASGVTVPQ
jgi:hypothetical protein